MKKRFKETITHLREDIGKVDEPQLKAMFETSAEVLTGLTKAFDNYEKKNEAAWRKRLSPLAPRSEYKPSGAAVQGSNDGGAVSPTPDHAPISLFATSHIRW